MINNKLNWIQSAHLFFYNFTDTDNLTIHV